MPDADADAEKDPDGILASQEGVVLFEDSRSSENFRHRIKVLTANSTDEERAGALGPAERDCQADARILERRSRGLEAEQDRCCRSDRATRS